MGIIYGLLSSAAFGLVNIPKTVGPLPLIRAFTAPSDFNRSLISAITGYSGIVTVSSTLPSREAAPYMSRFRIAAIMPSMSGWSDGRREAASRCSYTNLVETLMRSEPGTGE